MDGGGKRNRVSVNRRSRPYYERRCKKQICLSNLTNIESLPDELLFLILLELTGHEIYESAQFVCRKWYHMIRTRDFTHTHLQHSTPGLLIKYFLQQDPDPTFLTLRGGRFETFKLGDESTDFYWNTCNGLLLGTRLTSGCDRFFIVNPATKQHFALPPSRRRGGDYACSGIGYAPASMKYKVVGTIINQGCAIFTVGVDSSWRHVDLALISPKAWAVLYCRPLIIEGLVYWVTQKGTSLLSLNLESEVSTEIHLPQCYESGVKYYLSKWSSLTLLVESSSSGFSWDVWELKKPETGGEWKKLPKIDLEAHKCRVKQLPYDEYPPVKICLKPVGWLNYGEVLVLCISRSSNVYLLYNVVTQETNFLELDEGQWFFPYKSSLVWFDG